jgi:glycosyltransferase involved in cell wall biosynthesis
VNILYVCADRGIPLLGHKGASAHVRAITSALQARGEIVTVAIRTLGAGNPAPNVNRIEMLPDARADAARRLIDLAQREGIDIILERYSLDSGAARIAALDLDLPFVLEVNAPLVSEARRFRGLQDPLADEFERETFRHADHVQVVSTRLRSHVHELAPQTPCTWIPNGVDIEAFRRARPQRVEGAGGRLVIGFVGSMKPWHGVGDLLDAFVGVNRHRSDVVLVLVGGGPFEDDVRRFASSPEMAGRVLHLGPVEHSRVAGIIKGFDVAVAPYVASPDFYFNPLKVLEYLAGGVPVVFSDQGDLGDLVGTGGVGVPPGDAEALADAILRLLDDAPLRERMAGEGSRRVASLGWDNVAERVLQILARELRGAPLAES